MVKLRSQTARTRTLRNRVIADDNHNNNNNNNRKGKLSKKRSREQQSDETSAGKRFQPDSPTIDDRQPVQDVHEEPEDVGTDIVNANWQILGFIDAELTEKLIDCQTLETHKLCFHSDFQSLLLRDPKAKALYTQMFKSYLDSLENVSFLTTSKYEPQDGFTQMRVVAKKKFRPKTVISGLEGFTETVSDDELTEDMSFSVLPPQTILRAHGLCSDLLHSSITNATQTPDMLCPVKRTKRSYQFRQLEQSKLTKKFQFFIALIILEIIIGFASAPHA